jgi:hypothetical protein
MAMACIWRIDVFADHLESQGSIAKPSGDATRHLTVMGNSVLNSVLRGERAVACQFGACFKVCLIDSMGVGLFSFMGGASGRRAHMSMASFPR